MLYNLDLSPIPSAMVEPSCLWLNFEGNRNFDNNLIEKSLAVFLKYSMSKLVVRIVGGYVIYNYYIFLCMFYYDFSDIKTSIYITCKG